MQTSGSCLYSPETAKDTVCPWDPRIEGLFFYETTAIFSATSFADFVRDIKKLRDINPNSFCGVDIYNGFLIRFVPSPKLTWASRRTRSSWTSTTIGRTRRGRRG
ncbi:UNVERIFIED_CONTAM: L-gulonolactone oxidase 3 [Sesamum angustifolium]|uniref:L-gulonolactone oxidase 3 n=1 Tax=Sesamum angustifolium TaxID=2727405 RepID=A0AAW2IME5_9LAMI